MRDVDDFATNERMCHFALKVPAGKRRVFPLAKHVLSVQCPFFLWIYQAYIGCATNIQMAFIQPKNLCRVTGNAGKGRVKWHPVVIDQFQSER